MREKIFGFAAVLALAGCDAGESSNRPELTKRQADSALGASALPGAQGITRAMGAADSAAARSARIDSAAEP
jgi:uncharacterized lipoprotein